MLSKIRKTSLLLTLLILVISGSQNLLKANPPVCLIRPLSGESYCVDANGQITITWNNADMSCNVIVQYGPTGGGPWTTITNTGASPGGSVTWTPPTVPATWYVKLSQGCNAGSTTSAGFTVTTALGASGTLPNLTFCAGQTVDLNAPGTSQVSGTGACGAGNYAYKWQRYDAGSSTWVDMAAIGGTAALGDGNPAPSLQNLTWTFNTMSADGGQWRLAIYGCQRNATSPCVAASTQPIYNCGPVYVGFNVNIIIPFNSLTLTPGSTYNVCKGSGQVITANAAGGGSATYIFERSTNGAIPWTTVQTGTSNTYNVSNVLGVSYYRVRLQNAPCPELMSSDVRVDVSELPSGVTLTTPGPTVVCAGGSFPQLDATIVKTPVAGLNFQAIWQMSTDMGTTWTTVSGPSIPLIGTFSYTHAGPVPVGETQFKVCLVSAGCTTGVCSNVIKVFGNTGLNALIIAANPVATTICTSDMFKIDAYINIPCPGYASTATYDIYINSVPNTTPAWTCPNTVGGVVPGWTNITTPIIATGLPYSNMPPACATGNSPITPLSITPPSVPGNYRVYVVARTGCLVGGTPTSVDCQFIDYVVNQGPTITGLTNVLTVCDPNTATWNFTTGGSAVSIAWQYSTLAAPTTYTALRTGITATSGFPGANSLSIPNVTEADEGIYTGTIKSSNACADLIVKCTLYVEQSVTWGGTNSPVQACPGTNTGIIVTPITGSFPASQTDFTYKWKRNGVYLVDGPTGAGSILAGTSTATLTINNVGAFDAGNNYSLEITGYCGTVTVPDLAVQLLTPPSLSNLPATLEVCTGATANFAINGLGSNLVVNWTGPGGTPITPGGRITITANGDMQISNVTLADAGVYTVNLKNSCNTAGVTTTTNLSVLDIPMIATQVANQTACPGANVTFAGSIVTGTPVGTVTYSWTKNNVAIANGPTGTGATYSGATTASLSINGVKAGDAGVYTLIAKNKCGEARSAGNLTVGTAPSVSGLTNATICEDGSVTFNITAAGDGAAVVWKGPNNTTITNGGRFSITSSGDLTISNAVAADEGTYTVTVNGTCNPAATATATLTINRKPRITVQPVNTSVCLGKPATFNVTATGFNLGYQWFKNGILINGATLPTFTINSANASDEADYTVVVSGGCPPNVTSAIAKLKIEVAPTITLDPVSATVCPGVKHTFTVGAGGGVNYQWRKNGINMPGQTLSQLVIDPVTANDAGDYDVVVSLPCSSVVSKIAKLTVNVATTISAQPQDVTVCVGSPASMSVTATGTNLKYQWRKAGVDIPNGTTNMIGVPSASVSDAGEYEVIVTGDCLPAVTSRKVLVTVNVPPSIGTQPQDQSICIGSTATFTANATGTGISYQWRRNQIAISGATASTYTTPPTTDVDDNSTYDVVISGVCKPDAMSNAARLTLKRSVLAAIDPVTLIDTTEIDTLRETDVRFKNNGTLPVTISNVQNLIAPFSVVSTIPTLSPTAVIAPGQEFVVRVRFTPTEIGDKYDTLRLNVSDPCPGTFTSVLHAIGEDGKALVTLRLNDTSGYTKKVDQKVDIVISYDAAPIKLEKVNPSEVTFEIAFNGTMLTPVDKNLRSAIKFNGDTAIMTINIKGNIPKSGKIISIPMCVLVGNDSVTPVRFHSTPIWKGGKVIVTKMQNGSFKALDMCTRGGLRGTRGGSLGITKLTPNPANEKMSVDFFSNSDKVSLNLYDINGNSVIAKDITLKAVTTGSNYSEMIDVSELASGMYILVASNGVDFDKQIVNVVK